MATAIILYLVVKGSGSRAYMLRYSWNGRPQKMGLGSIRDVSLSEARDAAIDANRLIAKGINPREARDEKRYAEGSLSFSATLPRSYGSRKEAGFKHPAHKAKWKRTVSVHSKPLHKKRIDMIDTNDVLAVLKPIWLASRRLPLVTCGNISKRSFPQPMPLAIAGPKTRQYGKANWSTCCRSRSAREKFGVLTRRLLTRNCRVHGGACRYRHSWRAHA